jgi:hypothetical protein
MKISLNKNDLLPQNVQEQGNLNKLQSAFHQCEIAQILIHVKEYLSNFKLRTYNKKMLANILY